MAIQERYVTQAAAGGGVGSIGDPWTLQEAFGGIAAGAGADPVAGDRINIQADSAYTETTDLNTGFAGTNTQPIIYRGYKTTIGDGNQGRLSTGLLDTTNMPAITCSGAGIQVVFDTANVVVQSLNISSSTFTGSTTFVQLNAADIAMVNCNIAISGTGHASSPCVNLDQVYESIIDCDVFDSRTSSRNAVYHTSTNGYVVGCVIKNTNSIGVEISAGAGLSGCLIHNCGDDGVQVSSVNCRTAITGNTIVDNTGDGIAFTNVLHDDMKLIAYNLITDNGGYGINNGYSTALPIAIYGNRYDRNTSADTTGIADWQDMNAEITDESTQANEYTNAGAEDYSLVSTSPAIGATPMGFNIGYWQNPASGGAASGVRNPFRGPI